MRPGDSHSSSWIGEAAESPFCAVSILDASCFSVSRLRAAMVLQLAQRHANCWRLPAAVSAFSRLSARTSAKLHFSQRYRERLTASNTDGP